MLKHRAAEVIQNGHVDCSLTNSSHMRYMLNVAMPVVAVSNTGLVL
jgi:hypothetical protein